MSNNRFALDLGTRGLTRFAFGPIVSDAAAWSRFALKGGLPEPGPPIVRRLTGRTKAVAPHGLPALSRRAATREPAALRLWTGLLQDLRATEALGTEKQAIAAVKDWAKGLTAAVEASLRPAFLDGAHHGASVAGVTIAAAKAGPADEPRDEHGRWTDGGGGGGGQRQTVASDDFTPLAHNDWRDLPADPDYLYHATSLERAREIAETGTLRPHGPSFGTDQAEWPDGATHQRSYFSASPVTAWSFAPEDGKPVLLRVRRDAGMFARESVTGDWYTRGRLPATSLGAVAQDRSWVPVALAKADKSATWKADQQPDGPLSFTLINQRAIDWASAHATELIDDLSQTSLDGIKKLVEEALGGKWTTAQVARLLRTVIGLRADQVTAVMREEARLTDLGLPASTVEARVGRYAEAQIRSRAKMIARSELITAANQGQQEIWNIALEKGYLKAGETFKTWEIAEDEITCDECRDLSEDDPVPVNEPFSNGDMTPGAHPNCRCSMSLEFVKAGDVAAWFSPRVKGGHDVSDQPRDDHGRFGSVGVTDPSAVRERVSEYEQQYAGASIEHARAVFPDGTVLDQVGVSDHVQFSPDQMTQMLDHPGLTFTHNHPRGFSLSYDDVNIARYIDAAEMRAVTTDAVFSMKPGPFGWPSEHVLRAEHGVADEGVRHEFLMRIANGTLSRDQADAAHNHTVWTRLASGGLKGYLVYAKEAR